MENGWLRCKRKIFFYQHFNAEAKQVDISNELSSIRISNIISKKDTHKQSLDKVIPRISDLAPLAKQCDQDDKAKVIVLRNAVLGKHFQP